MRDEKTDWGNAIMCLLFWTYAAIIFSVVASGIGFALTCKKVLDLGPHQPMVCLEYRKTESFSEMVPPFPFINNWR